MPQFAANLSMMYTELPFLERFEAAAKDGFKAVEYLFPYAWRPQELAVYVDGADEIDHAGNMVKGGGTALTREKIVAAQSRQFICIADESKLVTRLGKFPLPVEVIPMAVRRIARQFAAMGGLGQVRMKGGVPLVTDNGQHILDVTGLQIEDPRAFELQVSQWPGVVTVGVFALQKADVCLLGTGAGVKTLVF